MPSVWTCPVDGVGISGNDSVCVCVCLCTCVHAEVANTMVWIRKTVESEGGGYFVSR